MSEIERVLNNCIECGICLDECDFLQKYFESPRELVLKYLEDEFIDMPTIPYSCNRCALCKFRCPQNLDIGKMTMEMCQKMVRHGMEPLSQHSPMVGLMNFMCPTSLRPLFPLMIKPPDVYFFLAVHCLHILRNWLLSVMNILIKNCRELV